MIMTKGVCKRPISVTAARFGRIIATIVGFRNVPIVGTLRSRFYFRFAHCLIGL